MEMLNVQPKKISDGSSRSNSIQSPCDRVCDGVCVCVHPWAKGFLPPFHPPFTHRSNRRGAERTCKALPNEAPCKILGSGS